MEGERARNVIFSWWRLRGASRAESEAGPGAQRPAFDARHWFPFFNIFIYAALQFVWGAHTERARKLRCACELATTTAEKEGLPSVFLTWLRRRCQWAAPASERTFWAALSAGQVLPARPRRDLLHELE